MAMYAGRMHHADDVGKRNLYVVEMRWYKQAMYDTHGADGPARVHAVKEQPAQSGQAVAEFA